MCRAQRLLTERTAEALHARSSVRHVAVGVREAIAAELLARLLAAVTHSVDNACSSARLARAALPARASAPRRRDRPRSSSAVGAATVAGNDRADHGRVFDHLDTAPA